MKRDLRLHVVALSQTEALFERPLPYAVGHKSRLATYLVANQFRPGAERSGSRAEVLGSIGTEQQAQKQTSKHKCQVLFVSTLNE